MSLGPNKLTAVLVLPERKAEVYLILPTVSFKQKVEVCLVSTVAFTAGRGFSFRFKNKCTAVEQRAKSGSAVLLRRQRHLAAGGCIPRA